MEIIITIKKHKSSRYRKPNRISLVSHYHNLTSQRPLFIYLSPQLVPVIIITYKQNNQRKNKQPHKTRQQRPSPTNPNYPARGRGRVDEPTVDLGCDGVLVPSRCRSQTSHHFVRSRSSQNVLYGASPLDTARLVCQTLKIHKILC